MLALNFSFLHCLGLIDMLSANQRGEIFARILLVVLKHLRLDSYMIFMRGLELSSIGMLKVGLGFIV